MSSKLEFGQGRKLWKYWTHGKGLARWASTPTPYRSLVAALAEEGVPAHMIHGLAANAYREVFKRWPGKHDGGHHGSTAGDKLAAAVHGK